jgi:D-cysteine desulfhydrase
MAHPLIFEAYPQLRDRLAWLPLGVFPTPVGKLEKLGREARLGSLYVKRDDLTSPRYGGNKVRKLEFLLADARRRGAQVVLTVGAAGSNHALATTIHGRQLGMRTILFLMDQPVARYVRRNLLLDHRHQAKLVSTSMRAMRFRIAWHYLGNATLRPPRRPYYIPAGGSTHVGCVGYVNAAFELKRQVQEGLLPEPDCLFVAAGTLGTASGLHLGCRLAGLKTRVIAVRVYEEWLCNPGNMAGLINRTCAYLRKLAPDVPQVCVSDDDVALLDGYFGRKYALFTEEGMQAVSMMRDLEGITLEGTYTGKALAGALDYSRRQGWQDKTILFWNTHNSVDLSAQADEVDYHELPRSFHRYFEAPLQELERAAAS